MKNPMRAVSPPKKRQREAKFYTPEQLGVLLAKAVGTWLELPVYICAYLGLRRGELCGLRWSDVDLEHQTITIENARRQVRKSRRAPKRRPRRAALSAGYTVRYAECGEGESVGVQGGIRMPTTITISGRDGGRQAVPAVICLRFTRRFALPLAPARFGARPRSAKR
ncbi:MAG: tyrosine-type recombinase/integrase [Butyricicoccus sp.]